MNRIEVLRAEALHNDICCDELFYLFYKIYGESNNFLNRRKYAEAFRYALSNYTPYISDGELIVGKFASSLSEEETKEWERVLKPIHKRSFEKAGYGQDSHMAIDYELVLSKGINGIIDMIDSYSADADESKKEFYEICKMCLEGVICHSENYAKKAYEMSLEETNEKRRKELLQISEICKKVPANPAETFHEAVQSVHFITYCIFFNPFRCNHQQFQLGHPDRYLLPFYKKDIKSGKITPEKAQLILDLLGIQINNRVPSGLSSGYMVGGRDEDGNLVENELTDMCMQVIDDIRLVYPAVGLCVSKDTNPTHLKKACEILSHGRSHPAIFNDDIITKGLMAYGVDEKQAHNYIHSTCVEITPVAASNVWVASPYTNMAQILLDCMNTEYESFDAFF